MLIKVDDSLVHVPFILATGAAPKPIRLLELNVRAYLNSRRLWLLAALLLLAFGTVATRAVVASRLEDLSDRPIGDLSVPAEEILALSPDVAKIEVLLAPSRPTYRVIHIADAHYLSRERYRILPSRATEEGYTEYIRQVEELQKRQRRLLCWLVDDHGLREIFQEAVSAKTLPGIVDDNPKSDEERQKSRIEVRALASRLRHEIDEAESHGKDATALRTRERDAEKYLGWRLTAGVVRDLLISRPWVKLLPAEDEQAYQAALQKVNRLLELRRSRRAELRPGYGKAKNGDAMHRAPWHGPEWEQREAAIVQNLLSRANCAVVVLGGAHDLSKHLERLGEGRCEYVRVTPKGFPQRVECHGRTIWVSQ